MFGRYWNANCYQQKAIRLLLPTPRPVCWDLRHHICFAYAIGCGKPCLLHPKPLLQSHLEHIGNCTSSLYIAPQGLTWVFLCRNPSRWSCVCTKTPTFWGCKCGGVQKLFPQKNWHHVAFKSPTQCRQAVCFTSSSSCWVILLLLGYAHDARTFPWIINKRCIRCHIGWKSGVLATPSPILCTLRAKQRPRRRA